MAAPTLIHQARVMFLRILLLGLLLGSPAVAPSQQIKLILLDSQTAQPIPHRKLDLDVREASSSTTTVATRTDLDGMVRFTIDRSTDLETATLHADLHDLGAQFCDTSSMSILQVVREGFTSANCAGEKAVARTASQPGVLVLYVYRLSLWERVKRMLFGDC